jgi:RHS repeat-associated protein
MKRNISGRLVLGLVRFPAMALVAMLGTNAASAATIVKYYHLDAVGSVRAVTDESGNVVEQHPYLPFGEEWCAPAICASDPAGTAKRFTGKERDNETNLDYFGARYYRANIGRFTTPDPAYTLQDNLVDPQKWNRYAYVRNNPLRYIDPDGRIINDAALQNNREYQKWKAQYLSQEGGPSQWNALNDDPGITVNVGWDTKGMASVTAGYVWDDSGKLTTVNVTVAAKTGKLGNAMDAEAGYVYGSTIEDAKERHAYVLAHELAHVEFAQTATGRTELRQRDQDAAFLEQKRQELGLAGYTRSPEVSSTHERVMRGAHERETGADRRAQEVLGSNP